MNNYIDSLEKIPLMSNGVRKLDTFKKIVQQTHWHTAT